MPPEEKKETPSAVPKPLRTYQSDVEEMLREGQGSLTKIALAEESRKQGRAFAEPLIEDTGRSKTVLVVSLVLIGISLLALGAAYFIRRGNVKPTPVDQTVRPLITADTEKKVSLADLDREGVLAKILGLEKNTSASLSSVVSFVFTDKATAGEKKISASEFFRKIKAGAPGPLLRSLDDNFLFGVHAFGTNQPFLIFKTNYYQNAFAGMLQWERSLEDDLGPLFIKAEPAFSENASTSDEGLSQRKTFQDMVVKNRDARGLKRHDGKIIFLYSFPDKNTIVITTNADTLGEIASRIIAGKLVQ